MNKALVAVPAGCVIAAFFGYSLARHPISELRGEAEISTAPTRASADHGGQPKHQTSIATIKPRTAEQFAALKKDLRKQFYDREAAGQDWALREQAAGILATLSDAELEDFARVYLPKNKPEKLPLEWRGIRNVLFSEILRQWALRNPEAACQTLADTDFGAMSEVFAQWQRRDPAAARDWLDNAHFPKENEQIKAMLNRNFESQQVTRDFSSARESLGKLTPEAQVATLSEWSKLLALDPAKRDELLALLDSRGDAAFAEKCYQNLVGEIAKKSPADAANFIESTNLAEEQKNKLNDQVIGEWAMQVPQQAFAKWAELGRDDVPPAMLKALSNWSLNSPGAEQAIDWANQLPAGATTEQFKDHLIKNMRGGGRLEQAAELSNTLADPTERIRQLKISKRLWDELAPGSKPTWYDKLPQADKDAIGRKLE